MSNQIALPLNDARLRRAAVMARHFRKLSAMRDARLALFSRPLVGRDVFTRFMPWDRGELVTERKRVWRCSYFDLLAAYARVTTRMLGK